MSGIEHLKHSMLVAGDLDLEVAWLGHAGIELFNFAVASQCSSSHYNLSPYYSYYCADSYTK